MRDDIESGLSQEATVSPLDKASVADSDDGWPSISEIEAADDIISNEHFGIIHSNYTVPFSRQLKHEVRHRYPVDKPFYNSADSAERKVIISYIALRLIEIGIYYLFLRSTLFVLNAYCDLNKQYIIINTISNKINNSLLFLGIAVAIISVAAIILRLSVRMGIFAMINSIARTLSYNFHTRFSDLGTKVVSYSSKANSRVGGREWPVRACAYTKAALWNGERAEYMDRYSATVSWRIHFWILTIERLSWVVMIILVYRMSITIIDAGVDTNILISTIIFIISMLLLFWGPFDRKKASFWADEFRKQVSADESTCSHHFSLVSDLVKDLVAEIVANDRNVNKLT